MSLTKQALPKKVVSARQRYIATLIEYYIWMRIAGVLPVDGNDLPRAWSNPTQRRQFMEFDKKLHRLEVGLNLDVVDLAYLNRMCEVLSSDRVAFLQQAVA